MLSETLGLLAYLNNKLSGYPPSELNPTYEFNMLNLDGVLRELRLPAIEGFPQPINL
jgi:hypothetical protein